MEEEREGGNESVFLGDHLVLGRGGQILIILSNPQLQNHKNTRFNIAIVPTPTKIYTQTSSSKYE